MTTMMMAIMCMRCVCVYVAMTTVMAISVCVFLYCASAMVEFRMENVLS